MHCFLIQIATDLSTSGLLSSLAGYRFSQTKQRPADTWFPIDIVAQPEAAERDVIAESFRGEVRSNDRQKALGDVLCRCLTVPVYV